MLAQSMTHKKNRVHNPINENSGSGATRVREFARINSPEFLGSSTNEDPQNFLDKIKKIFEVMQVNGKYRVKLASYQLKDVVHIWAQMNKLLYGVSNLVKIECRNAMLMGDMNISRLMTHSHHVEGAKLRKYSKENKNSTTGNYDYSQQKSGKEGFSGCGQSRHRLRDCPSRQGQGGGNGRAQSTNSAAPASRPNQQGNSAGTGGGQRLNRLYVLYAQQD
ncbi:uncharacterized protein [Solanum lycopersicum]|uniref:uncharacterized protein n=1 Tax=Solanum lycopersicum TaxID=4081 RepID=UPI0037482C6E